MLNAETRSAFAFFQHSAFRIQHFPCILPSLGESSPGQSQSAAWEAQFMVRNLLVTLVLSAAALAVGCGKSDQAASATPKQLTIAVIPKGTEHIYWKTVEAGAEAAGNDLGVKILWKGTLREDDRAGQIEIVQDFVAQKVDGIVLAPLDKDALQRAAEDAMSAGIKVDIIDSALTGDLGKDFISFIATDNHAGGMMGGEELCRIMGNKGKVVLLRYEEGSASTLDREQGFLDAVAKHPDVQVLVSNQFAGASQDEATQAADNLMDQIKQADGIFCSNDPTTTGMLQSLRKNGLAGKVKFIGFDANDTLIDALRKGEMDGFVVQNPRKMGYEGVRVMVNALQNKPFDTHVDSGAKLVTKDNLDDPDTKQLLGL
jgi:ribose transport system substrate-binding protein